MSTAFARSLGKRFDELVIGPPQYAPRGALQNLVLYPLFATSAHQDPPDLITLSEAVRRGARVSDTGTVSRLHIDNPLPTTVLAGESDLLMGPTQLRAVQFSCLVPPERRTALPVNCVEEGQPTQYQATFEQVDTCPWTLRAQKMEQLARQGEPTQYWLWDSIKVYLREANTVSSTHDLHAVMDRHAFALQNLRTHFPVHSGQVGAVCAVGSSLTLELFGDPEILEDRHDHVLRSAMAEALVRPGDEVVEPDRIPMFLDQVVRASQSSRVLESRGLKASGRALAFTAPGLSGAALIADGHLIHVAARQSLAGMGTRFSAAEPGLAAARQAWEDEPPEFLETLSECWAQRRRRYRSFKERLKPLGSPSSDADEPPPPAAAADDAAAPRPLPLHAGLHGFFMRLFSIGR